MIQRLLQILGWPVGFRFPRENEVVPILRWGRYKEVKGSLLFWIMPFIEQTLPPISTGVRAARYYFPNVMSQDNIPFTFNVTVRFQFDPTLVPREVVAQLIHPPDEVSDKKVLVERLDERLKSIVRDYAGECLYRLASRFRAEELCRDLTRSTIQQELTHYLEVCLQSLGLIPLRSGGVLIHEIVADEKFKNTMLSIEGHEATLRSLSHYEDKPDLIDEAMRAEFVAGLEDQEEHIMFRSHLDLDHPYRSPRAPKKPERKP